MKFYSILFVFLFPVTCFPDSSHVVGDIDCDGNIDTAHISQTGDEVVLTVTLHDGRIANQLVFGLGDSMRQDGLCGVQAYLNPEEMENDLSEILGQNPEGYRPSGACLGLNISGGECDSIHIFWNHVTNEMNWWRL